MSAIRRPLDPLVGPLLGVALTPGALRAEMMRQAGRIVPSRRQGLALLDTGAKRSCVHTEVGFAVFHQVGMAALFTPIAATPVDRPVFFGSVKVLGTELPEREQEFLGAELGYEVQGERVLLLLGRDFLADFQLVYDGKTNVLELRW